MHAPDERDAARLRTFLGRARRRLRWLALAGSIAAGLAAAFVAVLVVSLARGGFPAPALALLFAAGGAVAGAAAALLPRRTTPVATEVERRAGGCRNVLVTAAELLEHARPVHPYVGRAVLAEGARLAGTLDLRALFSARRAVAALGLSAGAWLLALALTTAAPTALPALAPFVTDGVAIADFDVVVTPPSYTGQPARTLRNPQRVEALAGSRITLSVRAAAERMHLETLAGRGELARQRARVFTGELRADADGFIALEPVGADGRAGVRRLVGLTVTPDRPPQVRITAPGRDLLLPDGQQDLALEVDASDDFGLAALRLTYTRVTGFGEQYTFTDGELPLAVTRRSATNWTGRVRWPLGPMELQPGDMVVYRATAADTRPGAPGAESDTYIVEIIVANAVTSGGFSVDEELDRYALSQQMVILLTERLLARRASLAAEQYLAEVQVVAAAQRRVRSEFVFMLGGELEDEAHEDEDEQMQMLHEEAHARAEADLAEGRAANQGRIELTRAIQAMSRAIAHLSQADADAALDAERTALLHIQRAFSRTRYILRALTERERLDLSRRLTGALATAATDTRPRAAAEPEPHVAALRRALADAAALAHEPAGDAASARAWQLAQATLRIDATSEPLRDVATALSDAATAFAAQRVAEARAHVDSAVSGLTALVRGALPAAPDRLQPASAARLEGAVADALREARR